MNGAAAEERATPEPRALMRSNPLSGLPSNKTEPVRCAACANAIHQLLLRRNRSARSGQSRSPCFTFKSTPSSATKPPKRLEQARDFEQCFRHHPLLDRQKSCTRPMRSFGAMMTEGNEKKADDQKIDRRRMVTVATC